MRQSNLSKNHYGSQISYIIFTLGVLLIASYHWYPASSKVVAFNVITSGCDYLSPQKGCQLITSQSLSFWIPSIKEDRFKILLSSETINSDVTEKEANISESFLNSKVELIPRAQGLFFEIKIPIGKHRLTIEDRESSEEWSINISKQTEPDWLVEHKKITQSHQFKRAIDKLHLVLKEKKNVDKALVMHYLARAYLANNEVDRAAFYLDRANELFSVNETFNKIIDNSTVLIYIYLILKDNPISAKAILDSLPSVDNDAKSVFYRTFYTAHLNSYLGEIRLAESRYFEAQKIAHKFNLEREEIDTEHMHSRILVNSGKFAEAIAIRKEIINKIPDAWSDCRKAKYHNGLGWAQNQLLETQPSTKNNSPLPALTHSLQLLEKSCPKTSTDRINVLINLSKYHYLENELDAAYGRLEQVKKIETQFSYQQKLEILELEALFELAQNNYDASIVIFEQLWRLADQVKYSNFLLKALVGIAKAHEGKGEADSAIVYYERAEQLVFNNTLSIPVTGSQPEFLASKVNFSYRYVDLLSRSGKMREALEKARKFRSHWLSSIFKMNQLAVGNLAQNREWITLVSRIKRLRKSIIAQQTLEWSLPFDQIDNANRLLEEQKLKLATLFDESVRLVNSANLSTEFHFGEPKENELFLFFYPITNGWIGFSYEQTEMKSHLIQLNENQSANHAQMASEWVDVFSQSIDEAKTVIVFPFGEMKSVDFRTIPYKDANLFRYKNVLYGVDLKRLQLGKDRDHISNQSLIVANSLGDLKETELEAKSIENFIARKNWRSKTLTNEETVIEEVKQKLQEVQHFHYAGHVFSTEDYLSQYQIPLTKNVNLNSTDILMLKRVPRWVVLSACNSSTPGRMTSTESLGLAHAFVIAGSEQVIATSKPVADKQAKLLMTQFYQHWKSGNNFAETFRQAQLDLIEHQPEHDWLAFRVITL
ncbi:CHAT domain-containing protein [Aliikangiella coralliicola]|uniref:CHAT domain-containing protein n=1 Tax=Aliikangiella coralliicola TaxID=2592383 RepID=A0A545UEN2_9GAMM|nr:CHAT domain-containing protein [Aliikangiella coralliicola]TQV87940.1 CHAT domain-containing protein [Aliikangiella coralliicola]